MGENNITPILQCTFCKMENSPEPSTDCHKCPKCENYFCPKHSSNISPQFCQNCFKDVRLIIERVTKTEEEYDEYADEVRTFSNSSKKMRLDGPDWVWYTACINKLTDDELKTMIEFHRFVVSLLEHVTDVRKIQKNADLRNVKVPLRTTTVTTTRKKRVTQPKSLEDILRANGLSDAQIASMLAASKATK